MPTPTYTIQKESTWAPIRASTAPTVSSAYSDDLGDPIPDNHPAAVPALITKPSYHPSYHAHPQQQVNDYGPQIRQSRLPIFKTVRSMLHKPPPITTPGNPKWDDFTGELSEEGKPPSVKPSTYVSPYEGAFKAHRKRSPERPSRNKSKRNVSPVSVLRDDEMISTSPNEATRDFPEDTDWSPVSPVSPISVIQATVTYDEPEMMPEPLSPNVQRAPPHEQTPSSSKQIKRKPVSRCVSTAENDPPIPSSQHSPSQSSDWSEGTDDEVNGDPQNTSHFSWTTVAPSVAPNRHSIDTVATRQTKYHSSLEPGQEQPKSRFSWSTVATNTQNQSHVEMSPPSPPPPVPSKFTAPPVQSILSRRRPIQRIEREEWTPAPRDTSRGSSRAATPKNSSTPTSAHTARPLPLPKDSLNPSSAGKPRSPAPISPGSGKALPPPPTVSPANNLTHLESLLAQERSILLQRKNVEKAIKELEKIEVSSPLDVPFATVRDTKRRLGDYRARLAEVRLEERDLGIAIARARRKDEKENGGDGESLWVRRVTG